MKKIFGLVSGFVAVSMAVSVSATPVFVDFGRDLTIDGGTGLTTGAFDNNSPSVTNLVDPSDPTRTLTLTGEVNGVPADVVLEQLTGGSGFGLGVQTNPLGTVRRQHHRRRRRVVSFV